MTREQAIFVLECVEAHGLADDAKRIAIEALKSEPIVRCVECKHWAMHSLCSRLAPFDKVYMGADDYCSKGKRMDEVTE